MSKLGLLWEPCTSDTFPHDTNLYVTFDGAYSRLLGWVRKRVDPERAGYYVRPANSLMHLYAKGSLDASRAYPTRVQAMRALRHATMVTWIAASPEQREAFIRRKGK